MHLRASYFPALLALGIVLHVCLAAEFASAYDVVNRWSATQIDGGGLQPGDPVTLRWSLVPDGQSYERSSNSQLIQFLDDGWDVSPRQRTPDFTNRPWFEVISNAYAQYSRVTAIDMVYVAEQTAAGTPTGMVGDIRLGGENIDNNPGGVLADNVFPDGGDMRIDTTRESDGSVGFYFSTEPGLRNLVIHETGHGVGLGHTEFVNNSASAVMEGGIRTDFWGLQFDDIFGLNVQYGDPLEKGGGNDTAATSTDLGTLSIGTPLAFGVDAADSRVEQFDDDWLGIRGATDQDWFRFTPTTDAFATITATPQGPTYETVQQGVFDASAQSNLTLRLYSNDSSPTLLASSNTTGIGEAESFEAFPLSAGEEYLIAVGVRGGASIGENQFYRLDFTASELPLPGTSADLNLDGSTNLADWSLLVANSGLSFDSLTPREAFMLGDLDSDGDNDYYDLKHFKAAYALVNGSAALAELAATRVPEPASAALTLCAVTLLGYRRRRAVN